ncbi:MAG: LysM peptidoglycan-binding domain-containing protein [Clostridia bacterium]|nr:LysM peptidoglycan-binding domain-containing protein [Clostridia bacterium]
MIKLRSVIVSEGVYYCLNGDTLDSIAKNFSTSKHVLIRDNSLDCEVEAGDCIYVKRYKKVYTVGASETVEDVAKILGITKEKLIELNGEVIYPYMQVVSD